MVLYAERGLAVGQEWHSGGGTRRIACAVRPAISRRRQRESADRRHLGGFYDAPALSECVLVPVYKWAGYSRASLRDASKNVLRNLK